MGGWGLGAQFYETGMRVAVFPLGRLCTSQLLAFGIARVNEKREEDITKTPTCCSIWYPTRHKCNEALHVTAGWTCLMKGRIL